MKLLIAALAILGVACAHPGFIDGAFGEAAKAAVDGFANLAGGVADAAEGAAHAVVGGATGIVNGAAGVATGAAKVFGKAADAIFGFQQNGKVDYYNLFQYYNNLGIQFFPNYGCCSCPPAGIVKPGYPNFSRYSPFFINGVYKIYDSEFCTCPPELVASAVQAAHYKPGILGIIDEYVYAIPHNVVQV